jgi:hypothetical protein
MSEATFKYKNAMYKHMTSIKLAYAPIRLTQIVKELTGAVAPHQVRAEVRGTETFIRRVERSSWWS